MSTERFVAWMAVILAFACGLACGVGYGYAKYDRPDPPPVEMPTVRLHCPWGLNLPPGTLIINPHGGMLFIPDNLGGRQKADVAPIANSYVKRFYATPEGCILPVWAPPNCGLMKRGELYFVLFDELLNTIKSLDVFDNP